MSALSAAPPEEHEEDRDLGPEDSRPAEDAPEPDLEVIVPEAGPIDVVYKDDAGVIKGTYKARVRRVRSREFFALARMVSHTFGGELEKLRGERPEDIGPALLGMLMIATVEASEEFMVICQALVDPVDPNDGPAVADAMMNPPVEVLLDVAQMVAVQEADDIVGWVGKFQAVQKQLATLYRGKFSGRGQKRST